LNYALPVLVQACALLAKKHTTAQFLAPVSAPAQEELVQRHFRQVGLELRLLKGVEPDAVQLADVAAVCSGTATLEFACLGVPMVVVYPTSMLTVFQYWLFRKLLGGHSYAGMPNIIADREIVKELLGPYAKPQAIADELDSLLCDRVKVEVMRNNLMEVRQALGEPGASARTAGLVLQLLAGNTPSEDLR
jgi:lipid-A-disaccharide synthase